MPTLVLIIKMPYSKRPSASVSVIAAIIVGYLTVPIIKISGAKVAPDVLVSSFILRFIG